MHYGRHPDSGANMSGAVLVTGAAGFIGAHAVLALTEAGREVVAMDCRPAGKATAEHSALFVRGDFADPAALSQAFDGRNISAALHFAASISVPESLALPAEYWRNNVAKTVALAEFCVARGVRRFVFSSSAAVYGEGGGAALSETSPLAPVNPYGATKMAGERIFSDLAQTIGANKGKIGAVSLRYFNVAGADPDGRTGDPKRGGGGLFKAAMECATGARDNLALCGTDFPTPDGSAVRDYIHVSDVAAANVLALDFLEQEGRGGAGEVFNCGLGRGFSVREVAAATARAAGAPLSITEAARRPGDPASILADATKIRTTLGFAPKHPELDDMVKTALAWERKMQAEGDGV